MYKQLTVSYRKEFLASALFNNYSFTFQPVLTIQSSHKAQPIFP